MVTFETVVEIVPVIGLTIALLYYAMNLRNQNITRKAQLTMNFYTHVTKREFWQQFINVVFHQQFKTIEEWDEKYGPQENPDAATDLYTTMQIFEGAGTLLKEGVIEADLLFRYLPKIIIGTAWERYEPWITGLRASYNDPMFGEMFEYLKDEAKKQYPDIKKPRFEDTSDSPILKKVR